jgi:hypothetical protein
MAYAGFEGMDGHRAADWENGKAVNADWTDTNGYYGGHYGYGGYGYGAHGSGNRKNEEEDNWDDGSNDKEKEGYYPTREDIKEDTKMLSKLKPDWMTNPWHYGYGGYGYGGKDGKSKDGDKKEEGKKGEEAKGDDKAEDKEAIQAAAEDFETADSAEDPRDNAAADDSDAINVQTKTSKTHKKKRGPKSKRVRLS